MSDTAWVLHWTLNIDNKPEGNKWLITSLSSSVDSNGRNHRNSNSDSLCLTLTRHNDNGYSYFHIHDTDGASFGGSSNPNSGDGTATYDFPLDTDLFCELRRTSATEYIGTIRTGSHTGTVIGTITGSCASTVTGLRYLQFSNWDTTSVYDNGTFDGYIKDVKLYNNATEYSSTISEAPNAGTQYRETNTRKIYRFSPSTLVDSSASSLTDVVFDASTEIGDLTYSGNEITRSGDSYWRHGINSNFFFKNSGTQTVECVAQNTGTSSWVTLGLSASKLVDVGVNSDAPNQLEYAIRAADDGRTWIRQSSNNWTQVADTADNSTFKITNNRTTVTYYANGSSIGTTTHGTPASTYYIGAFVSQTGTDGSFVFDYSGDITTFKDNGWKERGTA